MSLNINQKLLDEFKFKQNISAYINLTDREKQIHQAAFMSGYKLGHQHASKSKTITKYIYVSNKNKDVRINISEEGNKKAQYILNKCLRFYNRTYEEIMSPRRLQAYAECRSMIVNLIREFTPLSLPAIGRIMGGRDHTTMIHHTRLKAERRRYWSVHHITWKHYEKLYKELELELKTI